MASGGMRAMCGLALNNLAQPPAHEALWRRLALAIESDDAPGVTTAAPAPRHARRQVRAQGDISGFEPFFRTHQRDIFTYLWRMTSDEQASYDLTQETFLRAWRHFARIRNYERPGGWLFRVATHLALNHLRARTTALGGAVSLDAAHSGGHALSFSPAASDPGSHLANADAVRRALMAIPPRQRAALALHEVYGLTCEETAAALGVSVGAAKTLLWRARGEFRSRYAEEVRA